MAFSLVTTTNARKDIEQAIEWENTRHSGLGERFIKYLNIKFNSLCATPYMGTIRYDNVRCTSTDIFQYLIHYIVDTHTEKMIVLRVLHTRQKPVW